MYFSMSLMISKYQLTRKTNWKQKALRSPGNEACWGLWPGLFWIQVPVLYSWPMLSEGIQTWALVCLLMWGKKCYNSKNVQDQDSLCLIFLACRTYGLGIQGVSLWFAQTAPRVKVQLPGSSQKVFWRADVRSETGRLNCLGRIHALETLDLLAGGK